jgi:uncharacterized protein (TIRG00374 family)
MRKFLLALGLLLGVIFVITRFTEVQNIYDTLQKGNWQFILLALLVEAIWIVNIGLTYRSIYRVLGMGEGIMHMLVVGISSIFVNVVTPSAGMSSIAVFISDARRRGYSQARAMVAWTLNLLFDYTAFLCVLVLGLAVLARRNDINWAEIFASFIILFGAAGLATMLYLGLQSGKVLGNVLAWLAKLVNKLFWPFIHRSFLQVDRAYSFASDAAEGVSVLRQNPRGLIKPLFLALLNKTLLVTIFLLTFLAFQVTFSAGTIIAGFSIGYLFMIVSPTPSGIGIVEGVLTLTLVSLWVPVEDAAIITLVYRGFTFWIPLFVGMFAFRHLPTAEPPLDNNENSSPGLQNN